MPFFTVILPTFNRATRTQQAIASVIDQTFPDWELIVVDDGSTDNTAAVVRAFNDPRILYVFQTNSERSAARNKGLSLSKGEYVCFLDSDDRYTPEHLQVLQTTIQQKGAELLRTFTIYEAEEEGLEVMQPLIPPDSPFNRDPETHFVNVVCNPTALCVKRTLALKEKFNISLSLGEDFDYIIRLLQHKPVFVAAMHHTVIMVEHKGSTQNQRTPDFHEKYIRSLRNILHNGLIHHPENVRTLTDRIRQRYRWMAECYRLQGNSFKYWYYKIFARLIN